MVDFNDKKDMDERQEARGTDTDSGSKAGDKRVDSNGCSPWHIARNAKGKGGGGGVGEKKAAGHRCGEVEKETVNRTKQTQKKWKDHGVKVGFQVSHTGAQNQESRPPFPVRTFNTAPQCKRDLGGYVVGRWEKCGWVNRTFGVGGVTKDR